ncbi:MAG TPA: response regulator [Acidobacteriota bacterium]|nr:response regulator [Acidobacteriota bacterium]HRR26562.1 response regulator [Acidobacteriota bacterium]
MISSQLQDLGFEVTPCTSAAEAMRKLGHEIPHVLVTDLRMPGTDGLELLREVRTRAPNLPIVFLTAYGTIDLAVEAVKHGAFDFLTKPVEISHLEHVIRREVQPTEPAEESGAREDLLYRLALTPPTVFLPESVAKAFHRSQRDPCPDFCRSQVVPFR